MAIKHETLKGRNMKNGAVQEEALIRETLLSGIHLCHCLSFICQLLSLSLPHLPPFCDSWRAQFVISQVMSVVFFALTSAPSIMRYQLCYLTVTQSVLIPGSNDIRKHSLVCLDILVTEWDGLFPQGDSNEW